MIDKFDKKDKENLALVRRRNEIYKIQRELPWRKLKEPIQDGWIAEIVLNQDASRRKDATIMNDVIKLCSVKHSIPKGNMNIVSKIRKSDNFNKARDFFMVANYQGGNYYSGPHFGSLKPKVYESLTESQKKWFSKVVIEHVSKWGGQRHRDIKYICNISVHNLAIKIHKNMLTKVQDINPSLLKEKAYIEWKLQEYYRKYKNDNWYREIDRSVIRRHWKDAISHCKRGDIEIPQDYLKLKTRIKKM